MRIFFIIILLFFSTACFNNAKQYRQAQQLRQQEPEDTSQYAVIPYTGTTMWVIGSGNKPASLSTEEIREIDSLLQQAVIEHNDRFKNDNWQQLDSLKRYKRQLVPTINEKGEKTVWINCFCDAWGNWRKELVMLEDGGKCYFNLLINLTTGIASTISVNGLG